MTRVIETLDDVAEGVAALCAADPRLAATQRLTGLPPLRRTVGRFEGLAWIIVSQQVSVASARAIWARTRAMFAPLTPAMLATAGDERFRAAGLSGPKIRTL